ncbi:MAG: hypothetical protein Q8Q09_23955 [Deltaproteobacteria bacterium]|nr:hypothetical protein [Deltaproteobacteria bacterium]
MSLEERAAALTPAQVRRPNVTVGAACSIVLGSLPRVKEHLPDVLEVISGFDTDLVHGLRAREGHAERGPGATGLRTADAVLDGPALEAPKSPERRGPREDPLARGCL